MIKNDNAVNVGVASNETTKAFPRRRFVRGIGVAVPIALSVSAKSALACHCTSVSANSSIKLANSHNATADVNSTVGCAGWSPLTWKTQAANNYPELNAVFSSKFPNSITGSLTMLGVLQSTNSSNPAIQRRYKVFAAAYLNIFYNKVDQRYYKVTDMQDMWPAVENGGEYAPVPNTPVGKGWSKQDILDYFIRTWP
ncbi:MAG: hypothetical protein Q8S26_01445 [Azonexus sp.]|nr:hypothetical protein [Azonexus sp.]